MVRATTWRVWRARAIHTQRLSAFLPTKEHSSSSSSTRSSEGGVGSKVRDRGGNLAAFFEPAGYCVARDPEGARKTPEAGAFLVSAKDLLTPFRRVGVGARVLAALPTAIVAEVLLFAVGSPAVLDDVFAAAVVADDESSNHSWILPFGLDPLPDWDLPRRGAPGGGGHLRDENPRRSQDPVLSP